jgi:hypothetical protein
MEYSTGIKTAYARRNEFDILGNTEYLMNLIDNLANDEYITSDQDVLRARIRTTGISDSKFQFGEYTWKFFHRGGWSDNPRKFARNEYTSIVGVTFMAA